MGRSVDFNEDVRISDTILKRLSEAYRKLRNTFRYALGNLDDFDPAKDAVPGRRNAGDRPVDPRREPKNLSANVCALVPTNSRSTRSTARYDFATIDLSSIYFDVLKDRLYTSAPNPTRAAARKPRCTASTTRWFVCWRRSWRLRRKRSGAHDEAVGRSGQRSRSAVPRSPRN